MLLITAELHLPSSVWQYQLLIPISGADANQRDNVLKVFITFHTQQIGFVSSKLLPLPNRRVQQDLGSLSYPTDVSSPWQNDSTPSANSLIGVSHMSLAKATSEVS